MSGPLDFLSSGSDLGSGIGGGIGSALGYYMSQGDRDAASQYESQATDQFRQLPTTVEAQQAQLAQAGPSAYGSISTDPATRAAQMEALSQLKSRYSAGGLDSQAQADIANVNAQAAEQAAAQRGAVANSAAARGLGSSGAMLAASRSAGQAAANTSALAGVNAVAAGQNRADAALNSYGGLASGVRGQDYQQAADKAAAADRIAAFNAQNTNQMNEYNATNRQSAQGQSINNAFNKAAGISGGLQNQANGKRGNAKTTQQFMTGQGEAIGGTVGAAGGAVVGFSDERLKTNVVRHAEEALPGVPVATWEYLSEPGVRYRGVIAQDLEKVAPEFVGFRDGYRTVDYSFAPGLFAIVGGR